MNDVAIGFSMVGVLLLGRGIFDWIMTKFGPCVYCGNRAKICRNGLYYCSVYHAKADMEEDS